MAIGTDFTELARSDDVDGGIFFRRRAYTGKAPRFVKRYAEIGVTTNFSFLRGASHPQEYVREAGTEGLEMIMWLVMRGALEEKVEEIYRFYHVPASSTAVANIVLRNGG